MTQQSAGVTVRAQDVTLLERDACEVAADAMKNSPPKQPPGPSRKQLLEIVDGDP
jgi:hypothetical protein